LDVVDVKYKSAAGMKTTVVAQLSARRAGLGPLHGCGDGYQTWDQVRERACASSELARWCDDDLFGFLAGYGVAPADQSLSELDELVGDRCAVLVRDQLLGPW